MAGACARPWGSGLANLADASHINVESGFGDWRQGLLLLRMLSSDLPDRQAA